MTKMLIAVLALSAMGYLAYRTMYGRSAAVGEDAPTQQLENVRGAAKDIEAKGQDRVEDIEKKTE